MKQFTRYYKQTGQIICQGTCPDHKLDWQETDDFGYVEGHYDGDSFFIENNAPVAKPAKPDDDHDWDAIKKKWKLNNERKKEKDDAVLAAADKAAKEEQHEAEHAFIRQLMKEKKNG